VSAYPNVEFKGSIAVIDSKIDDDTKSINVQAVLPNRNDEHLLIPGMFASVKIIQSPLPEQVVIPKIAVSYTLYGNSVYVITQQEDGEYMAVRTFIQTGDEQNDEIVVTHGLSGNELIVRTGQVKLDDKARVSFKEIE
jgi:membrane fusion protein (multidrug efflux system)